MPDRLSLFAACVLLAAPSACAQQIVLDGTFDDWASVPVGVTDPAGDATGAFDVTEARATLRGGTLFLRFDISSERNLQSGSGSDGTLVITIQLPSGETLRIDTRARTNTLNGGPIGWNFLNLQTAPTFAATEFEARIDLSLFGVSEGDTVQVAFEGSDTVDAMAIAETSPLPAPTFASPNRAPGSEFRIASLNTLQSGIIDFRQTEEIGRLVDGVNAEIYAFQEEYDSNAQQIATFLGSVDPLEDGRAWNVHKNFDNVVASPYPVTPIPGESENPGSGTPTGAYAAAVVDLPFGPVIVLSIHPKCCGSIGSSEDDRRIRQTGAMALTILKMRAGSWNAPYAHLNAYRDAPVVVIGDWNLVGSRQPLTLLESPEGAALTDLLLTELDGIGTATWIGGNTGPGSFQPGRLDLCAYDAQRLSQASGFLVDTRRLPQMLLDELGMQAGDSGASDHLLMVTDFRYEFPSRIDVNGDEQISVQDINFVVSNLGLETDGAGFPPGDTNASGDVTVEDITIVVNSLGR
ncbi:MAG: hypothetical protein AAGD00_04210 [Planctomycetota bacterium]